MSLFKVQAPAQALNYPALGRVLVGGPRWPTEKARFWEMGEIRELQEVTGDRQVPVRLGDKVAAGHLPNRWLLTLLVVEAGPQPANLVGYSCPFGTFTTKGVE